MSTPLHVEVVQKRLSRAKKDFIRDKLDCYLSNFAFLTLGATLERELIDAPSELKEHVQSISFCNAEREGEVTPSECEFVYHVFRLDTFGAETDTLTDSTSGEELSAATVWTLPHEEFHGLWDSLVYESSLKADVLRYADTAFEFALRCVNPHEVTVNRVVLLHGPTGTGKTSLCRALAQKLAVRLAERFPRARLLEINAHSLFSKWFSESGKLVARLFARIAELAEDHRLLAIILVDEVESLAAARRAAMGGLEPSDAVRAVNAVLTQLDRLRRLPNVLVLATSNVTGAIDVAFVDRADIKRLVGPPSARAAYAMLRGCCVELGLRGMLANTEQPLELRELEGVRFRDTEVTRTSLILWRVASEAAKAQLSGRALRRLPFLASALHVPPRIRPNLEQFLSALHAALRQHVSDMEDLREDDSLLPALNQQNNCICKKLQNTVSD